MSGMTKVVKRFYDEGFESELNHFNPYSRAQLMPFCAWQAGFYDAHGEMPKEAR